MSNWDNVIAVSKITLIANNASTNKGNLFLNGRHRLPFSLGISFTLETPSDPGPTDQEIIDALSWINYGDGSDIASDILSFYDSENDDYSDSYNLYYSEQSSSLTSSKNLGNDYQNNIDFQVTSPQGTSGTPGEYKIAISLSGNRSDGSAFTYQSNSSTSGSTQAYFDLSAISQKVYGVNGSSLTPIICSVKEQNPNYTITANHFDHDHDEVQLWKLYIDDSNFKIHYIDNAFSGSDSDPRENDYAYKDYLKPMWDQVDSSGCTWEQAGESTYNAHYCVRSGNDFSGGEGDNIFEFDITINQLENEIVFIVTRCNVKSLNHAIYGSYYPNISLYDQFGNNAIVTVHGDGLWIGVDSVYAGA
ncbi:hypothetical protein M5U04_06690 [Xenorhabdus sp. XENO-1]|uniref:hypothetical protein n=1 Tax=Xenorhabdus bovienii TaxID=40576 RepID=UPI0020CA5FA9|nr:hypothetical protein [Xenorhabdus bovienii]MCP9267797.1 hypothetical protein [Xenorhabdus bovienii subsp. africana]